MPKEGSTALQLTGLLKEKFVATPVMAAPTSDPAVLHQQVMSAQSAGSRLPGEDHGPDYGNMPPGHEQVVGPAEPRLNGVTPETAATSVQELPATGLERGLQGDSGAVQSQEITLDGAVAKSTATATRQRDLPGLQTEHGIGATLPVTLPVEGMRQHGAEPTGRSQPFFPSPLPGQSPLSFSGNRRDGDTMSSKAAMWFSRLGDLFQQRRVEVTTWSQSPTGRAMENPWTAQRPFTGSQGALVGELPRTGTQTPPSTGSAGVPREMVQAEVAKQLDGAMTEVYQNMIARISTERQRTEDAEREAQQLRLQLELMEQRMSGQMFEPPPMPTPAETSEPPSLLHLRSMPMSTTGAMQDLVSPPGLSTVQELPGVDPEIPTRFSTTTFPALPTTGPMTTTGLMDSMPSARLGLEQTTFSAKEPSELPRSRSPEEGRGRGFLQGLFGQRFSHTGSTGPQGPPGMPASTSLPTQQAHPPKGIAPPPVPMVASSSLGANERVLTAMAKGIETLLQNQSSKGERPETVKPGITELPILPPYTPETGSIDLINWVTHITPIMEDLSDSSSLWWSSMLKQVMEWYAKYSVAAPLERVQMLPVGSAISTKPEWARVERRATAMMLSAIPGTLKEEVIAVGGVNTVNLLAKLFSTYQPGNRQEKALVLTNLEKPTECQDAASAVEALRKWALWRRRASAIGITEPDASVLLQGLDRICQGVVRSDPELASRVSLIRSTLQVDVCPTNSGVTRFFQHLQAELEQQARLATVKTGALNPKLRAIGQGVEQLAVPTTTVNPPPPPPKGQSTQCRFFASEKGCRRGSTCRYPHTWTAFEKSERARRCLTCGAVGHKSKECKAPGGGASSRTRDGTPNASAKEPSATPSSAPSSTGSSPTTRRVTIEATSDVAMKVIKVLHEVKCMEAFQPLVSAVEKWSSMWSTAPVKRAALMDSGATHPLRRPHDEKEWLEAVNVNVALAGEARTTMKQNSAGTLLSGDELSQVIVPLGRVIDSLGYRLRWSSTECCLERGDELLPLRIVRGCPEVDEATAHRLIQELETRQVPRLHEATMESVRILRNVEVSWWSCLVDYVTNGNVESGKEALMRAMFFGEEEREDLASLLLRQPNDGGWGYMKQLGLNRRTRKRLMRASTWIVRWDPPGFTRKSDVLQCVGRLSEVAYVNVGSLLAQGGFATTWRVLLWAACQGRLGTIMSKDVGATTTEFEAHARHRARVHLLHALSAAGQSYRGSITPRFLVERRRGASMDSVDWMCDGKAQRYCDEMNLPDPMFQEEQAIEIVNGLTGIVYGAAGRVRLAKMSRDASWRLHIMRNHQPFRRDCALCVRNAATGRQHRATLHPTGYTLSVDVAGPLKGFGKSPDGKYFKYFVIGAFRIPLLDGGVTYDEELRGHPIPEEPELDDDPVLSDEDNADELLEEEEDVPPIAQERRDEEEWKKLRDKFKAPLMTETLYFCVPVNSKKSLHVLPALQQMVIDIRGLGYPVTRIHSDRGGELRSNAIKRWVLSQGILRTTSTGSEPAENGVAEAGVRFLKRRGRILLDAAGLGREHWPTAIQTAALQQRCEKLALVNPMPVAYGAKVYVKTKKYKTGDVESMKPHWTQGRYLGPSTDVRGGHVILKSTGTFLTTTHVRVATEPPNLDEVAPTIIVDSEDLPPLPPPDVPPEAGASAPEHLGERPRVESPSSSGLGRGRSTKVRKNDAAEHLGERHRVESPSSSGLGRIFDDGAELPPYPKGPLDEGAELPPYPKGPPISYSPPVARVRGKSPGVRMKAMRLEGDYEDMVEALGDDYGEGEADPVYQEEIMMRVLKAQEKQAVEAVAVELLNAGDFSREACQRLLRALGGFHTRWKTPRATVGQGMILGAYVRGGSFGITTYGRELPNTLKFLNKFLHIRLQYVMPGSTCTWTTLALQRANAIPAHRDVHNQRGARNYVMEIADETLEGLWVEGAEGAQPVEGGDGVMQPHELQLEDGQVLRGRLHSIEEPVAFDPRARHALVNEAGMKWVLSAYTPSGVHQLLQADVDYLFQHGFPVTGTGVALPTVRAIQRVAYGTGASWETRPMSDASLVQPEFVTLSGSRVAGAQEEVDASIGYEGDEDGDEAAGDWELFVESSEDSCVVEEDVDYQDTQQPRLCRLCSSEDPGCERDLLQRVYEGHLQSDECSEHIQEAMAANLEEWEVYFPMIAKVEPEFTENIEALIDGLEEPLRHTHNVNPREVRASVEKWRASIEKELKVVEKGFERVTVDEIKNYKRTHQVQELPAKLVYTLKPPSDEAVPGTEAAKCKRKSRIVCCGNFNDQDPGDVFASGAAAESLRCTLVLAALRRWVAGGLDITGAFMLTPLPRDKTLIVITPPNILICLGLASPQERWVLTRAMYGLRQAPHLWSEFRDNVIKGMQFELHGSKWKFRQGGAEPNIWYLFQEDASTKVPAGVLLIYVDDLLLLGPPDLVNAMASSIQSTWKTSTLELVEPCRGIRFLGCEIETNEARDAYWIHQKPYVVELLRHHNIPSTARSPIPCPKDMLSLQIEEDEDKGDEHDLRQAQKLCGELLWLSQRSRPDIAFPVSIMGSLLTRAAPRSIAIGQRLLSYLQRTMGMALELRPTEGGFEAWSDCSFAPNGSKPHSGMTITWDKAVISWRSGRQPFTCLSTAEGELVAAIETLTLSMSMKAIVDEFGVPLPATTLCIDNQAALVLANPSSTASWRTRHLRIRSSFLREKVDQGEVKLLYVPGKIQLADLLTKGFPRQRLEELCGLWGLVDMFEAASQMKLVKVMVMMTMLVQTARGSLITKDPIPLETSWELYVVLALVVVAVISFWECGWSVWYTLSGQETPAQMRKSRRVKRMKDAIEEEIQTQMASRGNESTNTMLASAPIASSSTESAASSSTGPTGSTSTRPTASRTAMTRQPSSSPTTPPRNYITGGSGMQVETRSTALARGRTVYRADQKDKACQTEAWMIPSPRPLIQYVDREVPVPIAEASGWTRPIWVSEHGDHFHTLDYCWGLRNSKHKRRLLYCTLCRDNFGRSLYPDRG